MKTTKKLIHYLKNILIYYNLKFIDYIRNNVASGYVGKLTEFYIYFLRPNMKYNISHIERDIKYIMENIKDLKIKPIDTYYQEDFFKLLKDVKIAKIVVTLNKIKKNNSIKYTADINKIANYVYENKIDLSKIIKLPIHNKIHSDDDFIQMLSGSLLKNLEYHKDWNILYDTDDLLVYEILSYEGGLHLIHVNQCINNKGMYDNYHKNGYKLYNLIDKNNIDDSLFIDGHIVNEYIANKTGKIVKDNTMEYSVFKWDI